MSQQTAAPTMGQLFTGFLGLGLMGFGGVLPMARHMMVERRGWLTPAEFTDLLGLCQFLPGGNIINMSVAVGLRFRGIPGAAVSLVGLIAAPSAILIGLGSLYARFADNPVIMDMLAGLAAAAAGLIISTAIKMALPLRARPVAVVFAVACFVAIAVLRLPLLPTMLVLAPLSVLASWRFER